MLIEFTSGDQTHLRKDGNIVTCHIYPQNEISAGDTALILTGSMSDFSKQIKYEVKKIIERRPAKGEWINRPHMDIVRFEI